MTEFDIYTGKIEYKGIDFSFVFNKKELRLIPPVERRRDVELWFMEQKGKGVYTLGKSVYIEDDYLTGTIT